MTVLLPRSLDEALGMKAAVPAARPVAGGTDLLVRWTERPEHHRSPLLDLSGLAELRGHHLGPDRLVLGATTTFWDLLCDPAVCSAFPLLAGAARQVGAIQVQARGTWGGNIANASPAADGVLALMLHDAEVELASTGGIRRVSLAGFYVGYRQTVLGTDQLITAIHVPRRPATGLCFEKVGSRSAQTISKVGLALGQFDGVWRVAVNSMAPTVRRCSTLERILNSGDWPDDPGSWLAPIREDLTPVDDHRSTRSYREQVLARLLSARTAALRRA